MSRLTGRLSWRVVSGLVLGALMVVAAASVTAGVLFALAPGAWGEGSMDSSGSPGTPTVTVIVETAQKLGH